MKVLTRSALVVAALFVAACTQPESDGRHYHGNISPIQGKMGVTFKHVPVTGDAAADAVPAPGSEGTTATASLRTDGPPGLLDPYLKSVPDEPGAEYWMHGRQSPDPIQSKMGVRVKRIKKS